MKQIALAFWKDRISPVFDTARSVLIVTVEGGDVTNQSEMRFFPDFPAMRVRNLSERGVSVLICGAISRRLLNLCAGAGLTVFPWICGSVDQVLEAFLRDDLSNPRFVMPGCCGRRVRARQRGGLGKGQGRGGGGGGGGGRGRGMGKAKGQRGSGPSGFNTDVQGEREES